MFKNINKTFKIVLPVFMFPPIIQGEKLRWYIIRNRRKPKSQDKLNCLYHLNNFKSVPDTRVIIDWNVLLINFCVTCLLWLRLHRKPRWEWGKKGKKYPLRDIYSKRLVTVWSQDMVLNQVLFYDYYGAR